MSLRNAILGFLAIKPMSGYDLRKHIDASVRHFWPADQAQIYRTLQVLVSDGLAVVEDTGDSRQRRLHSATPAGLAALDDWLRTIQPVEDSREPFLIKMFFGDRIGSDGVRDLLQARRLEAKEMLATFEAIAASIPTDGDLAIALRRATLLSGLRHVEAEILWIDETLESLK